MRSLTIMIFFGLGSCGKTEFKSSGGPDPAATESPVPASTEFPSRGTNGTIEQTQSAGGLSEDNSVVDIRPQLCTAANIFFAGEGTQCPKNYAAFSADDGNSARFGCCPLPSGDMLMANATAAQRQGQCGPDEVATGVVSGRMIWCSKINTQVYKIGPVTKSCYNGSGSSGGSGSSKCTAPGQTLNALTSKFGSDACLGYPFGSLMVKNSGKDCKDISAVAITKLNGSPVQMYNEN
jgi:hypothetical protein